MKLLLFMWIIILVAKFEYKIILIRIRLLGLPFKLTRAHLLD